MSIINYFEAGVERYLKSINKTAKIKREMKEMILQFNLSELHEELGSDEDRKNKLKRKINEIKREIY